MELKKKPKADIRRWSGTLLNFGLATSIGLTLAAFEWKSNQSGPIKEIPNTQQAWELIDIPLTIQTPPPPPPKAPPVLKEQPNDIEIEDLQIPIDINTQETDKIPDVILSEGPPIIDEADEIRDFTEVQASFKGGMEAWYKYLRDNLKYPPQARRMGIEGTVLVRFVINKDGSVQDVEIMRSIGGGCDEEAIKVIEGSPNWNPGKMGGLPVRSRMVMPIKFRLN
ncbi:energy transducer TonB [Algoriphagus algorifonticola]|uniref:energy transducer TonB n=1 Tax=Algoriphagus algorifonticola TaxID=2593007 RepID=UPI00119F9B4A|nr:energy transducer TonB [Algoriphagus algorifonticola]